MTDSLAPADHQSISGRQNKELILINPCHSYFLFNFLQSRNVGNPVPHALLTLAALTPQDYRVTIVNQRLFWHARDFKGGCLVGITCLTSAVSEAYRLADRFRGAGAKVVLGGAHVTALPEEALTHADSVVLGEAESVWSEVLKDYEAGTLKTTYKGEPLEDFFTTVYDYYLRLDPRILNCTGIHIDRGCKYHCDFCARISHWLRPIKMEQVLELIKRVAAMPRAPFVRKPLIRFACDNIYSNPSYAKELFAKMIPLGVTWAANCSIDIGFDEEALRLAQASGCRIILAGFETMRPLAYSKTSLKQFRTAEDYRVAIKNIKARGIRVNGSFILGLDDDTHADYLRLFWFLVRSGLWFFILTILAPFPGSALFERLKKEGRIRSFDWRKYIFLICLVRPRHMSVLSVYVWFWFIRVTSVFFSPYLARVLAMLVVSTEIGYRLSRYLLYGF